MSELLTTVSALSPDVIGVTESWGNSDISDHEFSIRGFTMLRSDCESDHRGGGVLLFVKNVMHPVEVKMEFKFTDQVWCKIKINNGEDLLIGVCYHSPNMVLFSTDKHLLERVQHRFTRISVVTIASEPASIDYDRSFEKKSRCRCQFDVTWACGLTIS